MTLLATVTFGPSTHGELPLGESLHTGNAIHMISPFEHC